MLTLVACLCAVVALSSGCCTPDQWEGQEGIEVGYAGFIRKGLIKEYVSASYDYTNKRTAATLYYRNGKAKGKFQMVVRYDDKEDANKGKLYFVDLERKKCWKKTLNKPFRKACVPASAKKMGDFSYGLKGPRGLNATSYEIAGKGIEATVAVSIIGNNLCIPLEEIVAARRGRWATFRNVGFANITPGIKDPKVFDVPATCEETKYHDMMEEVSRDFYTFAV